MNNQQLKILKYIYNTPRTFSDIKNKFHLDNTALRNLLNGDDNCIDYYNGVQQGKNFDENSIVASNLGRAFIDLHKRKNITDFLPMILSTIAIIISIASFVTPYIT